MKIFTILATLLFGMNAMAYFNEVECSARNAGQELFLEVEQPFPNNSVFRRAVMTITQAGGRRTEYHNVSSRRTAGLNRIDYYGARLRIEIDLWPDSNPQWGRSYRARVWSTGSESSYFPFIDCTFPNAQ